MLLSIFKRGLKKNVIEEFGLGYVPKDNIHMNYSKNIHRGRNKLTELFYKNDKKGKYVDRFNSKITFPIKNISKETIAFGGRIIEQ